MVPLFLSPPTFNMDKQFLPSKFISNPSRSLHLHNCHLTSGLQQPDHQCLQLPVTIQTSTSTIHFPQSSQNDVWKMQLYPKTSLLKIFHCFLNALKIQLKILNIVYKNTVAARNRVSECVCVCVGLDFN